MSDINDLQQPRLYEFSNKCNLARTGRHSPDLVDRELAFAQHIAKLFEHEDRYCDLSVRKFNIQELPGILHRGQYARPPAHHGLGSDQVNNPKIGKPAWPSLRLRRTQVIA